jgi:hypothetical protein
MSIGAKLMSKFKARNAKPEAYQNKQCSNLPKNLDPDFNLFEV